MCKCLIDVGAFMKAGGNSPNLDGKVIPGVEDLGKRSFGFSYFLVLSGMVSSCFNVL